MPCPVAAGVISGAARIKQGVASMEEIARLVELVRTNGGIEYAINRMKEFRNKAFDMLMGLPDTEIRESLIGYLDYIVIRDL